MSENTSPTSIHRTRDGKILAGVCTAVARQLGVDVHLTRLGLAIVACFTGGTAVAIYAAAWLLIPDEGKDTSIAQNLINKHANKSADKASAEYSVN